MQGKVSHPAFNSKFRVMTTGDDTLLLLSETEDLLLQGRAYAALAPLIDGRTTSDQLVRMVRDTIPPAEAYFALMQMEQLGYITEAHAALSLSETAFWNSLGVDAHTASLRLNTSKVTVTAFGDLDPAPLADKLHQLSIVTTASSAESAFNIVLTDHYLRDELRTFNQRAHAAQRPWLLAKPVGSTIWLGPFFRPEETACWECLAHRLRLRQSARNALTQQSQWSNRQNVPQAATSATWQTAWGLITNETGKLLVLDEYHTLHNRLISIDLLSLQTEPHTLVRRPQCPVCGDKSLPSRQAGPLRLQSGRKHLSTEGGARTVSPEETLRTYDHHISPITGIIKQIVADDTCREHGLIHNCIADENAVFASTGDLRTLRQHLRSNSAGKGVIALQARVGALCESIERYSGLFQGEEPRIQASCLELGDRAIHPHRYLLFSERQYDSRHLVNGSQLSMFEWIPQRFDEQRVIDWTPLWSLTEQRTKYLPTSCCYYSYPDPSPNRFARADSNGAAAGNTLEEAILQGFFELAERDAVAIWWYNRLRREQVELASFQHPYIAQLQHEYRDQLQREIWVLNLTHDLKIPTFAAISRILNSPQECIIMGFGAHFDPEIALLRALTEMNQSLPLLHRRDPSHLHAPTANWWQTATLHNQPYLQPDRSRPAVTAADFPFVRQEDILEDVRLAQQLVEQKGLEMLVLDQTRPDVGLPVVKVIIPGLRHFWTRFAPGRLYEVPVQMKWLPAPLAEEELNPIPMFM